MEHLESRLILLSPRPPSTSQKAPARLRFVSGHPDRLLFPYTYDTSLCGFRHVGRPSPVCWSKTGKVGQGTGCCIAAIRIFLPLSTQLRGEI